MSSPDAQVLFALGQIATCRRSEAWQVAHAEKLTPTQSDALLHLARRGATRSTALAQALGVSTASLSDSVQSLAAKRLVRRTPDPTDQRAQLLDLTAEGKAQAERLRDVPTALSGAIAELAVEDQGRLLRLLTGVIRSLQERRAIPAARMCVSCRYFRPNVHDDAARPHHCDFVNAAFGDASLRLDCGEHEMAPAGEAAGNWRRFAAA